MFLMGFVDTERVFKNIRLLESTPFAGLLDEVVECALCSAHPDSALNNLERIARAVPERVLRDFLRDTRWLQALLILCGASPFLTGIMLREPSLFEWLFLQGGILKRMTLDGFKKDLRSMTEGVEDLHTFGRVLRRYRNREFLRIGARDLLGLGGLEEITGELSDLAGSVLDTAVGFCMERVRELHGTPLYRDETGRTKEAEFTVIGLGKLGGGELNFSSDIDILYIYSSDRGESTGIEGKKNGSVSLHTFFVKVARLLTRLVSEVTEDGFVFRTDLDLRPEGRSGDIVNSLRSAEIYYESWGQMWERAVMIKAREVAGSQTLGKAFLEMIRPFVYRKYLDFTAIEEIRSMKEKIDLSLLRRRPGTVDVKLGRGGIREIEFFCQTLQLIHGGRDASLRERNTLKALERLRNGGYIRDEEFFILRDGYIFLRRLEHRIQIMEGRQTQAIPAGKEELERLARMMNLRERDGKSPGEVFWEEYRKVTDRIHELFRALFYSPEKETLRKRVPEDILLLFSTDAGPREAEHILRTAGFRDPETARKKVILLRDGPPFTHLSSRARVALERIGPYLLYLTSRSPDPDRSLNHLERFLSAVGARTVFYSLLSENPKVMEELTRLFGTSDFLSEMLVEHPENLDLLLSREIAIPERPRNDMERDLKEILSSVSDYEERLESARRLRNQEVFRIGINDIMGKLPIEGVFEQMTFLGELCLDFAIDCAFELLSERYGMPVDRRFFIIGLGKLGGGELAYGSDLDILFVYPEQTGETSGPKRLSPHEFFVKIAQRIISILSLRTKEGFLFEVDTRLRPSGSAGPLVVSHNSLLRYYSERRDVWERQALVKARVVAGDREFGSTVTEELRKRLYLQPLTPEDAKEMLRIRRRMEVEIAREGPERYNIKTGRGGIVDIEFLAQALQLRYAGRYPFLDTPYTLEALTRLLKKGILKEKDCNLLKDAYRFLRYLETRLRIVHARAEGYIYRRGEEVHTLARRMGYTGTDPGDRLIEDYREYTGRVRTLYLDTLKVLSNP